MNVIRKIVAAVRGWFRRIPVDRTGQIDQATIDRMAKEARAIMARQTRTRIRPTRATRRRRTGGWSGAVAATTGRTT